MTNQYDTLAPTKITIYKAAAAAAKSLQSCPTPRDSVDCSLPGSSAHRIFQARVLEWGAISDLQSCVNSNIVKLALKSISFQWNKNNHSESSI